jgi:Cdc6-like AAA superfamily ATPase
MTGSFDWVVTSTEFTNWLNAQSNESLQIVGRPGSGKSTLAAFLVQHLSKSSSPVLYFFCNGNDGEKREEVFVLRTLLAQLLKIDASLANHIFPVYQRSGRAFADSHHVVLGAFGTAMAQQQDHAIYIVIDAVDECRGAWNYNGLLVQLQSCTKNTKAKFVITQRDVGKTNSYLYWSATSELTMKPDFASRYIHEYVKQRVQRMAPIANTDLETQVVKQISQSSDGLWLYARLMVDEVERP